MLNIKDIAELRKLMSDKQKEQSDADFKKFYTDKYGEPTAEDLIKEHNIEGGIEVSVEETWFSRAMDELEEKE